MHLARTRLAPMHLNRRSFLHRAGLAAAGASMVVAPWSMAQPSSEARKLKITGYETLVVNNIPPYTGMKQWLFIKLFTDAGLVGLGERPSGSSWLPNLRWQVELIHNLCDHFVVGQSPFDVERMWRDIYTPHDFRHPSLHGTPALSAIEMACWDLIGKATSQPIYNLLGGKVHDRLRTYSYLDFASSNLDARRAGEAAANAVERGQTACKIDPFAPYTGPRDYPLETIRAVARMFSAIRDSVGDRLEIGIGTHGQFTSAGAIRVANVLEEFDPFFFEEPVPPENVDEMARVAAHTDIPIATGERLVTKYEFSEVLQKQAAQIIQLDVGQCGGILESKKIAAMAEAHYAMIAPHMFCGPVAAAAAVHLDTCCPNFLIQEYNTTSLHSDILREPLLHDKGFMVAPTKPGLGIELDEKVVKRQLAT